MRAGLLIQIRVAAAFRDVTAAAMPAGRGLAPLADIPDRPRLGARPPRVRWTPIFGRPDKVEFPRREAPYQEQDDGR